MNVAHRILHDAFPVDNTVGGGKSAAVNDFGLARLQRGLPTAVLPFGKAAGDMIRATFWTHSQKRTAQVASAAVGASPDTLERIIAGEKPGSTRNCCSGFLALIRSNSAGPTPSVVALELPLWR